MYIQHMTLKIQFFYLIYSKINKYKNINMKIKYKNLKKCIYFVMFATSNAFYFNTIYLH